jgi:hypothetical protein
LEELETAILEAFLSGGIDAVLTIHSAKVPHVGLFEKIDDKIHISHVGTFMNKLVTGKLEEVVDLPQKEKQSLTNLACVSEEERQFLLYTAMFHDIGKAINRPRHGAVGADVILNSEFEDRKRFYDLGFSRREIYLLSNLIRFHDYFAALGTGETSYLSFAEVLCPVSNMALINEDSRKKFLEYLLLANIADVAGSINGRIDRENSMALIQDFNLMTRAHNNISRKVYAECGFECRNDLDIGDIHRKTIGSRRLDHIISELSIFTEDNTVERLRRLLRTGFLRALQRVDNKSRLTNWIENKYVEAHKNPKPTENWFLKDDQTEDIIPIIASLNALNIGQEFSKKFAFICKLDYELGFLSDLLAAIMTIEAKNPKREPHDLRRDIAMTLVTLVNTLVDIFGGFTDGERRIGLGFERIKDLKYPYKEDFLVRLSGEAGTFKQAEALTTLKNAVNLWVVA